MTDNHNTLDDLTFIANDYIPRCEHPDCDAPATRVWRDLYRCDAHANAGDREFSAANRIRRLVASGTLR